MKCPYCGEEMERGYLQSGVIILWTNKPHKMILKPKDKMEFIIKQNSLGGASIKGNCCKKCRRIILEY